MAAFTTASCGWRRWPAGALLVMLCACSTPAPPQTILPERCLPLSTAAPVSLHLSPAGGALRIRMRQRGIAATASLRGTGVNAATLSPDERYGAMSLLAAVRRGRAYVLRIVSVDSPELAGEVCIAADMLDPSDHMRLAAERSFAAAGDDTRARRWHAAFDHYRAAARLFDGIDRNSSAQARQAMAQLAYRRLHRDRDGYVLAQHALADLGSAAEPGLRSAIGELQATIVVESREGDPQTWRERALRLLDRAAALAARASFGAREQARLTLLRGYFEYSSGQSAAAAGFFAQAAAACAALKDSECDARALMNTAVLAEEAGQSSVALEGYAAALRSLSPAVAPDLAADIWDNLGRLQWYVGLFSVAGQSQLNAVALYAQNENCDGVRRSLSTLGSILVHVGELGEALAYLHLAASHDCASLILSAREMTHENFQALNPTASPAFERAFAAEQAARAACGNPPAPALLSADATQSIFRALLAIGDASSLQGDRAIAQRCRSAAAFYVNEPRLALRLANALGAGALERGEPQVAHASFLRALDVADHAGLAATHENRVVAYLGLARAALLAREPGAALGYATRALHLGSARADVAQVADALQVLACGLRQAGALRPALQTLRTAANLIERVPIDELDAEMRATYLATQHRVFEELTDLLAADAMTGGHAAGADNWTAFAASERGRARALQYAVSQASNNEPLQRRSESQHAALLARMADVAMSVDGAAGWSAAAGELEWLSAQELAGTDALDSAELVSQLERLGATFVEFAAGPRDMFAFVIDGADIHLVPLGDRGRIGAASAELFALLHEPESADADVQRSARRLAQLVLWPLTRHIKKPRVIFAADDSLHSVPFAVLPWSQDAGSALLLQHGEIAVVPSAHLLAQRPDERRALSGTPRFELFGDPIFQAAAWRTECAPAEAPAPSATAEAARDWTESLPRLPGSRSEVLAIASLARASPPASGVGVHLGCLATPSALRAAAASGSLLLHIATHGYVDALRPRLSALALTREGPAGAGSGVFGLPDILAARASARLVVLSACDTSRGRLLPGEGVLGPAQAFLQSGADSVIASYWRIDDAATAAFMQTFYTHLLGERLPIATALRRAQLEYASGGAHGWAGFALFGRPDGAL